MSGLAIRVQRLDRILELSRELTSTILLEPLLQRIVEAAVELTNCESAAILLVNEPPEELRFVAANNFVAELAEIPVPIDGSIAGAAFSSGEPIIALDARTDHRYYTAVEEQTGYHAHSLLAVPLQFKDRRIGVLEAENKRDGKKFDQEDVSTLTLLAAQATVAIENARLVQALQEAQSQLERRVQDRTAELSATNAALRNQIRERIQAEEALRRRNRELDLLNRASQELTVTLDLPQVAQQLLQTTTEIIGAEGASVWLWDAIELDDQVDEPQDWLVCWAASYEGWEHSPINMRVPCGVGIAGTVAQTGESAIVDYARDDPRFFSGVDEKTGLRTLTLLAVPLWVRGKVIGVLELVNKKKGLFDDNDRALVDTLAASAAIAIDNAHLVDVLRTYAWQLEVSNEELGAFAHTVAHDLKNPLNLVIGFTEVLVADLATMSADELRACLHTVARNGRKMNDILNELLLLAGVRKMEADSEELDMGNIVSEALQRLELMIKEHQAVVILPDVWPVALGYGPWIEEVWMNYLTNAIKYGGCPPRLELGATESAHGDALPVVRYWVRDNGNGITLEAQQRLFSPFTRLETVKAEGYGLGLSIVKRIVEKLGGQVGVQSMPDQGSLFFFTLPAPQAVAKVTDEPDL